METEEAPTTLTGTSPPAGDGDEPDPKKRKTAGFKSGVWSHFLRATDGQSSKCMLCASLIKTKNGSTTGLLVHLRAKHNINARKQLMTKPTRKDVEPVSPEIDEESEQEEFHFDADNGDRTVKGTRTAIAATATSATKSKSGIQVKKEAILEPQDEDDLFSVQLDEGVGLGHERIHESYERTDDQEITVSSLLDKSTTELIDIVLHLQYKCQATEIECQRVKTKLALLRLSHCQSRPPIKNGRFKRKVTRHSNADGEASEDEDSDYSPKT